MFLECKIMKCGVQSNAVKTVCIKNICILVMWRKNLYIGYKYNSDLRIDFASGKNICTGHTNLIRIVYNTIFQSEI